MRPSAAGVASRSGASMRWIPIRASMSALVRWHHVLSIGHHPLRNRNPPRSAAPPQAAREYSPLGDLDPAEGGQMRRQELRVEEPESARLAGRSTEEREGNLRGIRRPG